MGRVVGAGLGLLLLTGCVGSAPSGEAPVAPPPDAGAREIRYTCGGPPGFLPSVLDQPADAERELHPSAEALRRAIAQSGPDIDMIPDAGFWLVARDDRVATYLARRDGGVEQPFAHVSLSNEGGQWQVAGWGDCRPEILLEGLSLATWSLDPELPPPDAGTTSFTALVTERACTGAQPMLGRLLPPSITYGADSVSLVFAATPLAGDVFTCPGNPSTRVTVELRERLGERRLLDAALFPPRDASLPPA